MKIHRTLCCKAKIKTLKTGGKFVNILAYHAKRKILLNNQLLKHEQYVVQSRCSEKCSVERFAVRYRDNYVDCELCKSEMVS